MLTGFGTSTQSTYDIRTVAPHLIHYVDLTTKLVRGDRRLISGGAHTAEDRTQTLPPAIQFSVCEEVECENVAWSTLENGTLSPSITRQNEFIIFHPCWQFGECDGTTSFGDGLGNGQGIYI